MACVKGHLDCVRVVLKAELSKNRRSSEILQIRADNDGFTALHVAVVGRTGSVLRFLLETFADSVDARNKYGQTPLHLAARAAHSDLILALLAKGADPNLQDDTKATPLEVCLAFQRRTRKDQAESCAEQIRRAGGVQRRRGQLIKSSSSSSARRNKDNNNQYHRHTNKHTTPVYHPRRSSTASLEATRVVFKPPSLLLFLW